MAGLEFLPSRVWAAIRLYFASLFNQNLAAEKRANAANHGIDKHSSGERRTIVLATANLFLFIDGKNPLLNTLRRVRAVVILGSQTDEKLSRLTADASLSPALAP
jgi:hypothetical protein